MIELEKTYLLKYVPEGLKDCKYKEVIDIYIPRSKRHPVLRIRKSGDRLEITKKEPVEGTDSSKQEEQTINLAEDEFKEMAKLEGKKVRKLRYYYSYEGMVAEIDVFQDELAGLILADFEFDNEKDKEDFKIPDFCLADITREEFTAGGMVCGKKYEDIQNELDKFGYKKLFL